MSEREILGATIIVVALMVGSGGFAASLAAPWESAWKRFVFGALFAAAGLIVVGAILFGCYLIDPKSF